jgi:hypothetical protein
MRSPSGANTALLTWSVWPVRTASGLPSNVAQERIAAMTRGGNGEGWRLLASGLPEDQVAACKMALVALADRRHNWPQALRLANGFLRTRMGISRRAGRATNTASAQRLVSLSAAIATTNAWIDAKGSVALDEPRLRRPEDRNERYDVRHGAVEGAIDLNLSLLEADKRERLEELAVFPEHLDVPIGIAARLWAETGKLS